MSDTPFTSSAGSAAATRCLLWLPRGCDAPVDLLEALRSRSVGVREVAHAPSVMSELALHDYAALVIVNVDGSREADRLIASVEKYHPDVSVRRYCPASPQRLQRVRTTCAPAEAASAAADDADRVEPDEISPEPAADVEPAAAPPAASARPFHGLEDDVESDDEQLEPPLLTEEELAMLLGDDDADEEPTPS